MFSNESSYPIVMMVALTLTAAATFAALLHAVREVHFFFW